MEYNGSYFAYRKKIVIRKLFFIIVILEVLLIGCEKKTNADLAYPNKKYSYKKEKIFVYDTWCPYDEAYLKKLKEDYNLEELVSDCKTEFEKVQTVTEWVTNLWVHNGDNIPKQSDPLSILHNVTVKGEQYRCVEYGTVISGCLNALQIPTRTIGLKTQDVETRPYGAGHIAAEAYLKDYQKWVFIDGQWGMIPIMEEMPLNAVQFSEVLQNPDNYKESLKFLSFQKGNISEEEYKNWILEYLYYLDVTGYTKSDNNYIGTSLMLTPSDSQNPHIFQVDYPLEIDNYTHYVPQFYPPVK